MLPEESVIIVVLLQDMSDRENEPESDEVDSVTVLLKLASFVPLPSCTSTTIESEISPTTTLLCGVVILI